MLKYIFSEYRPQYEKLKLEKEKECEQQKKEQMDRLKNDIKAGGAAEVKGGNFIKTQSVQGHAPRALSFTLTLVTPGHV